MAQGAIVGLAPDLFSWISGFLGECRVMESGELRETMMRLYREATVLQRTGCAGV